MDSVTPSRASTRRMASTSASCRILVSVSALFPPPYAGLDCTDYIPRQPRLQEGMKILSGNLHFRQVPADGGDRVTDPGDRLTRAKRVPLVPAISS
jgi:hypothetical protein